AGTRGVNAEPAVTGAIDAAMRRARWLGTIEALGWGLVAAAISPAAGVAIAAATGAWRWGTSKRSSIVVALERAYPDARNLFVTADELSRNALVATPEARARVFADASRCADRLDLRAAFPTTRVGWIALFALIVWGGLEIVQLRSDRLQRGRSGGAAGAP